ncbi:MAG TPA: alkaline phosphatase family protein, partial [Vicinamibacterales bacterium]|nr:alkaline phosphatase family protein [Vicinamibacterales bacterium]
DVAILWLSDPDSTAHQKGIGSPATRESLRIVDAEIGRIEDTLRANGQLTKTDIIVTSDHGFTTHNSHLRLEEVVKPLARTLADGSSDIVVAEGAIYFRGAADRARVAGVVAALQARPPVGAIFTRDGAIPGTLPYDLIRWNHPRSGDILVSANWNTEKNEFGYEGITTQTGTAGHGSSSPYDIHNTLIAVGPDFREHATSDAPTGNADIAPTILRAIGMTPLQTMTGRIIEEMFRTGPLPSSLAVTRTTNTVKNADGSYELTAHISTVAGSRYLDWTETRRK